MFVMDYTTQMDAARKGIVTPQMKIVAEKEHMPVEKLMALVAAVWLQRGRLLFPATRTIKPCTPAVSAQG